MVQALSNHVVQFAIVKLLVEHPSSTFVSVVSFCKCYWSVVSECVASLLWQIMSTFDEIEMCGIFSYFR